MPSSLTSCRTPAWEVWVNLRGERFVAEDTPSPHHREALLFEQPHLTLVAIWDQAAVETGPPAIGPDWTRNDEVKAAKEGRWLHRAEDLTSLAAKLSLDARGLAKSVAEYNAAVRREAADPLGRTHLPCPIEQPPFYGVRRVGGMLLTRGGPRVDEHLRPLRQDGRAVPGVRLAGEVLGMSQFSGDAFAGGMSIGPALSLGRWAARQVAQP